jgi:hypothetical protein
VLFHGPGALLLLWAGAGAQPACLLAICSCDSHLWLLVCLFTGGGSNLGIGCTSHEHTLGMSTAATHTVTETAMQGIAMTAPGA